MTTNPVIAPSRLRGGLAWAGARSPCACPCAWRWIGGLVVGLAAIGPGASLWADDAAPTPADERATGQQAPGIAAEPTLTLDPERPEQVIGYWSNGAELLDLGADGSYRLFDTQNRYQKPIEVGRWSRQNYATLWLEPYTARKEQRSRLALAKADERTTMTLRKFKPLVRLDAPPLCEEDFVIGLWVGKGGTLELEPTMRYRYVTPVKPDERHPVVISSHKGAWRLSDGRVELVPDSPSVAKTLFEPARNDDGRPYMRLKGVEGTMERVLPKTTEPDAGAPERSQPASEPAPPESVEPASPPHDEPAPAEPTVK